MLIRIWKVNVENDKIADLKIFAETESLPMFKKQKGCLGVFFTLYGNQCATITLWKDMESINALNSSAFYNETVEKIEASGILEGEHFVEIFNSFGGFLETDKINKFLQP